ncbi:MFS transporter [Litchfieldia salsa]|uniref:Na+/melibiose symporter n=1 Tax=Litchfieldia salsa TaxID=930152 RepID=A0A1H0VMC3_9BACI|nr:MFS transporter [Litchfieldia salsa]SDP79355.1 Na+/melibiose symporter [Litchfieldia salsa]
MQTETNLSAKEKRVLEKAEREKRFNRAKVWQMALFPLYSMAHNSFMFLMSIVAYHAAGIVGLGTVIASVVITGSRIFDGITDPIIAFFYDKTKGKFGKVRPFITLAFVTMAASTSLIYFTGHLVPDSMKLIYFILLYIVFIIGYTFSGVNQATSYSIISNDPKQRPTLGGLQMIYTMFFYTIATVYLSMYLTPKYGGFNNPDLFQEFTIATIIFAGVGYGLFLIAIWKKDRPENFGSGQTSSSLKFKELLPILKGNRPLQMFIVAAATDKLGLQIAGNAVISVMLFGIVMGDYAMAGAMQSMGLIPNILALIFGTAVIRKIGLKKGLVLSTWGCIITYVLLFLVLWLGDPTQISMNNMGILTIAFIVLYIGSGALRYITNAVVPPMLADIVDYESYKSDRYLPGLVGGIYSFIDKTVSSLAQTFVGLALALIGFKTAFPDIDTPYSDTIFWMTMFLFVGTKLMAWISTIIAMRYYDLDKDRMEEIQVELEERRKNSKIEMETDSKVKYS